MHVCERLCLCVLRERACIHEALKVQSHAPCREFHALHEALISKKYHHNGIPALPPKKILFIGGDSVQELAADRQKALQSCVVTGQCRCLRATHARARYCNALASIPIIYADPDFCSFFGVVRGECDTPDLLLKAFTKTADK